MLHAPLPIDLSINLSIYCSMSDLKAGLLPMDDDTSNNKEPHTADECQRRSADQCTIGSNNFLVLFKSNLINLSGIAWHFTIIIDKNFTVRIECILLKELYESVSQK